MDTDLRDGAVDETVDRTPLKGKRQSELKQQTLPGDSERVCEFRTLSLYLSSGADDVTRLEPLGALQQIELHGFALVQRAVPILLDGGEMNEDIFPCGPLDKTISFSPVKPLYCTLLSHNKLLSPLLRLEIHILREARAYLTPSKPVDDFGFALQCDREPGSTRKAPEFRAVVEKTARSSGACRGGASFDYNMQNINPD